MNASPPDLAQPALWTRRPQAPESLAPETIRWMAGLPRELRPQQLPIAFTRIANALARNWPDPAACLGYLDELLIDRRGTRRGFPLKVALELASLKDHYETAIHPVPQTAWDATAARLRQG